MGALANRVARRFQAELLDKQWLMGVRRGWLSLLKPPISDWGDVLKAFDALLRFVDNLKEQVTYVRRAPGMNPDWSKKTLNAFQTLRLGVEDARTKARHWYQVATKTTEVPMGTFRKEDGDRMLELYRKDFDAMLEVHVPTKVNPAKGQWNPTRSGHMTELFDKLMVALRADAADVEKSRQYDPQTDAIWGDPTYTQFDLYGMKVVVDDQTVQPRQIREYIRFFDEAYHRLRAKKLGQAWYGTVFIRCEECGGVNQHGKDLGVGGNYPIGPDVVNVFVRPGPFVVELMAHELGHRYWYKFMRSEQRAKFESLIRVKHPAGIDPVDPKKMDAVRRTIRESLGEIRDALRNFRADVSAEGVDFARVCKKYEMIFWNALQEDRPMHALRDVVWSYSATVKKLYDQVQSVRNRYGHHLMWPFTTAVAQGRVALVEWTVGAERLREDFFNATQEYLNAVTKLGEKQLDPDTSKVLPVSEYGKSNISEAFAEVFAYYVLDRKLDADQEASFSAVMRYASLADRVLARALINRPR